MNNYPGAAYGMKYPAPQYPAPQYPAPQYPAPQYQAPQYPAPQFSTPQFSTPHVAPHREDTSLVIVISLGFLTGAALSVGSIVTGVNLLRVRSYSTAFGGVVLSLVNVCFCSALAIPFGFWALRILRRPDVIAAFQA
jgi:hypothetical protein